MIIAVIVIAIVVICIMNGTSLSRQRVIPVLICSVPLIYFFYEADYGEDLYRYYLIWDEMKAANSIDVSISEKIGLEYPGYLLFMRILTLVPVRELLPVITGIICYFLCVHIIKIILDDCKCSNWVYSFCYVLLLLLVRNLDILGVRNILAGTLFAVGLYYDLIEGKKRGLLCYLIATSFHGVGVLYIFFRILLLMYRKYNSWMFKITLLFSVAIFMFLGNNFLEFFLGIPMLGEQFLRVILYINGGGLGISWIYLVSYIFLYLIICVVIWYVDKYIDKDRKYKKLYDYTSIVLAATFGFISQRELFNRMRFLLIPLLIFYMAFLLGQIGGKKFISVRISQDGMKQADRETGNMGLLIISIVGLYSFLYFLVLCREYLMYSSHFVVG